MRIRILLLAVSCLGLVACGNVMPGFGPPQPVTFTVKAPTSAFSAQRPVTVRIYDAEQLAIAESTSGCTVSKNVATGEETRSCPPGVTYRPTTPEETTVPVAQLAQGVVIASKTVTTGERYRLTLGGLASDNCNQAGATVENVAAAPAITLDKLEISQTLMGCP